MYRLTCLAIGLTLATASLAVADMPPPPGFKRITPRVRFEGIDRYPGYTFFLSCESFGPGGPRSRTLENIRLRPGEFYDLHYGKWLGRAILIAVPADEARKPDDRDLARAWLNDKAPGLITGDVDLPATSVRTEFEEVPASYRVTLQDNQSRIERIEIQQQAPAPGRLKIVILGLAATASLILFGLWLVRRRHSPPPKSFFRALEDGAGASR